MEFKVDHEISLRQISAEFAEQIFALVQSNFVGELCYWCPDLVTTYSTLESTRAHILDAQSKFKEDRTPDLVIFYNDKIAGLISLSPIDVDRGVCEIGYWLSDEFAGFGIVSRAMAVILEYAKKTLNLRAVELSTAVPNLKSQALPIKYGFSKVRLVPHAEVLADMVVDHILWRLEFYE